MAIFAFSNDDRSQIAPIGAHPAFPAIVAVWFAVLLGLGVLVFPESWIERFVLASGIGWFVAAADPSLGISGRALLAFAAATAGALTGFVAARGMSASLKSRAIEGALRPLSASEELGDLLDWAEVETPGHEDVAEWVDPAPARREEAGGASDLAELVERLGFAIERRRTRAAAVDRPTAAAPAAAPEPSPIGHVSDATEAALRATLQRLRQLREAA